MLKKKITGILLITLGAVTFFLPFAILFILRYEDWTKVANSTDIVAGVMIGLVYAILMLRGAFKAVSQRMSSLITMLIFTIIFFFFDAILSDLFWISLSVLVGYVFFWILTAWGMRLKEIAKIYEDEGIKIKARETAQTQQLARRKRNINAIK